MLDLAGLTIGAVIAARSLIALERDPVLSRLWTASPGRVGLGSGLILRAGAYVALPLLTMFAVNFPEAGDGLLQWIEPVRQVLPVLW